MEVADHERISRFLLRSDWFSRSSHRVKPDAYIPHPRVELSVSCTEDITEHEIWLLGIQVVGQRTDSVKLYGRGDLKALDVRLQGLDLDRNDIPPRHANIVGWSNEGKAAQRMKAVELSAASTLVMYEP